MAGARSRRKTGTHFSGSRWSFKGAEAPKKEARPKGPGKTLLIAAQYSQKRSKNNDLFMLKPAIFAAFWARLGVGIVNQVKAVKHRGVQSRHA
jgi:hypothetical protein